jgi:hypothetical protein
VIADAVAGVAVITAAVVLCALGKFDSTTTVAVISTGAALALGAGKAALALAVPTAVKTTPPAPTGPVS